MSQLFSARQMAMINGIKSAFLGVFSGGFSAIGLAFVIFFESICGIVFDTPITPRGESLDLTGYQVVFEDEFNSDSLDLNSWFYRSRVESPYANFNSKEAVTSDGNLNLQLKYETVNGVEGWHSSMIATKRNFLRGYFEVRAICAEKNSCWSAFWLSCPQMGYEVSTQGGVGGAEIDIMESSSGGKTDYEGKMVTSAIHVDGYADGLQSEVVGKYKVPTCTTEYNTYGLLWTEDEYIFYINGVESGRSSFKDGVSEVPEYIVLSMEPAHSTEIPHDYTGNFVVDYVRVYQLPEDIVA